MPGTPEEVKELCKLRTASIRARDLACALGDDGDETPHTYRLVWDRGVWGGSVIECSLMSVCAVKTPKDQSIAIDEYGRVAIIGSGEKLEEQITTKKSSPPDRGPLREVREIGGRAYAVGMDRQVYRRDGPNKWVALDGDISKKPAADPVFGFESIHGWSEDDMYAVGWHGEIWHHGPKGWKQLPSPTNVILTRVFCAGDKNVYACGQNGILLRGKGSRWEVIDHGSTEDDLWDLQWFRDKLYVSTTNLVYTLEGDTLQHVEMGDEVADSYYHLDANDGVLWSIGPTDIIQFDGKRWTRIL